MHSAPWVHDALDHSLRSRRAFDRGEGPEADPLKSRFRRTKAASSFTRALGSGTMWGAVEASSSTVKKSLTSLSWAGDEMSRGDATHEFVDICEYL